MSAPSVRATHPESAIFLCHLADLPEGGAVGFNPVGADYDTIFMIRRGGEIFGWQNACPHQNGARMNWKKDAFLNGDRSRIMCSAHGALFDIETGLCKIGPCIGKRLKPANIRVQGGDVFYVDNTVGT